MSGKNTVARIAYLVNELFEKGCFTLEGLMEHIRKTTRKEICLRTAKRTVADLKEHLGLDIVYSIKEKAYVISEHDRKLLREDSFMDKFERIKRVPSKKQELLIFYSFVKSLIFSEYYFPPRENKDEKGEVRDYDHILRMIESVMKEELSKKDIKLAGKIEYHLTEHYKRSQRTKFNNMINEILDAMRHEYLTKFRYHDIEITVEPVKLIHYNGVWYLMAYVVRSPRKDNLKKVRIYNIALMQTGVFSTGERFTGDEYEIPEFKDTFGIISSSSVDNATIRFYGVLADRMKEMLWVDSQETTLGTDPERGRYCQYVLPYPANTSFELIGKVLSFRENAEITAPEQLRKEWTDTIRKMYDLIKSEQ